MTTHRIDGGTSALYVICFLGLITADFCCVAADAPVAKVDLARYYNSISLGAIDFTNTPFTNVLAEINSRLSKSNMTVRVDFSPARYLVPAGGPVVMEVCDRLIQRWKDDFESDTVTPQDVANAPNLNWHADDAKLLPFLRIGAKTLGLRFFFDIEGASVVLRPYPSVVHCRAYRLTPKLVGKLKRTSGGDVRIECFATRNSETNYMAWVEEEHILIRIGTTDDLAEYDEMLSVLGETTRLPTREWRPRGDMSSKGQP